jgi:bacteriocin biosynthesis cyclodehydratase domain-containing protein
MEMRPKFRRDALFLQTPEGVFLQSDEAMFVLKGKHMYRLLTTLRPYLNGAYTLSALCQELEPDQRATVTRLVQTLVQRGILQHVSPEDPDLLSAAVAQQFQGQIEFIEHYQDHPRQRFQTFRESRMLLIGSGETLLALAISLVRNGIRELLLACEDETAAQRQALENEVQALRQAGVELLLTHIEADYHSPTFAQHLATCDIAVYCADTSVARTLLELQQTCRRVGCAFLPAVFLPDRCVLGPLVEAAGPCWLCAQIRLAANAGGEQQTAIWQSLVLDTAEQHTVFFPALASRAGNALGFELFKQRTGALPSELVHGVICQDSETLEAWHAPLLPVPLCPLCTPLTPVQREEWTLALVAGSRDRVFAPADLLKQSSVLLHPQLGILHGYEDEHLTQLPLKVSRLHVASPLASASQASRVTAFHTGSTLDARVVALKEALQRYMSSLPDPRSMLLASRRELEERGQLALDAPAFALWSGVPPLADDERCAWLPAFSLARQRLCAVPAAIVYPFSSLNRHYLFDKTSAGLATDTTFSDLMQTGLCSALAYEVVLAYIQRLCPVIELTSEALEDVDTDVAFLVRSLKHMQHSYTLLEISTSEPIHVVIAICDGMGERPRTHIGWGCSGIQAVRMALLHLVGDLQLLNDEGVGNSSTAQFFPDLAPTVDPLYASPDSSRLCEQAPTCAELQEQLLAQGRDLLFVNTTTSDLWASQTVLGGKVLLTRSLKQER